MTPPVGNKFVSAFVEWDQGKMRNLVGGVMTPPYDGVS